MLGVEQAARICEEGRKEKRKEEKILWLFASLFFVCFFSYLFCAMSSDESMVQLIELMGISKRALETCQSECSRANQTSQETRRLADTVHLLHPKLRFLSSEITKQLEVPSYLRPM